MSWRAYLTDEERNVIIAPFIIVFSLWLGSEHPRAASRPNYKGCRTNGSIPLMRQPYSWPLEKRKSIQWAEAKTIPADFYKTARSLMKADEMVREFFPGWCVIKNKPVLEIPENYRPD